MSEAIERAEQAWDKLLDHNRAARAWAAIAREEPEKRELCEILSRYMGAYADADKAAEKELRDLAARQAATQGENA